MIVSKLGVDLCVFIACDLDQVVPVHDRSYLVLAAVSLLNFFVRCDHDTLVLDFLAGPLGAVVQQRQASLLRLVLSHLVLLDSPLFLLSNPAHVEFFGLDLPAFLNLLLVCENKQLLRHTHLVNALHVHSRPVGTDPTLMAHHLLLRLDTVVPPVTVLTMLPVAVVVGEVRRLAYARVLLSEEVVKLDMERRHGRKFLQHLREQPLHMLLSLLLLGRQLLHTWC